MIITCRLRLKDNHASGLNRQARAVNFVWNYLNETQKKAYFDRRKLLSRFDLQNLTAGSSQELGISSATIGEICGTYCTSRRVHKKAFLRFRSRKSLGWIPFRGREQVSYQGDFFTFRGEHYYPMHTHPNLKIGRAMLPGSFNRDSRGRWYINVPIEVDEASETKIDRVGIDLGLKSLASLSTGEKVDAPQLFRLSETKVETARRARKTKRWASVHAKIANRRRDFLHKASSKIANQFGLIVIGDTRSSTLAKTVMAKSVLDAGWYDFKKMILYKSIRNGGRVIEVSENMTSQTCSECGSLPSSRPKGIAGLGIREWSCDDCGFVHDRDTNAAKNILRAGLCALAEGAAYERSSQMIGVWLHLPTFAEPPAQPDPAKGERSTPNPPARA